MEEQAKYHKGALVGSKVFVGRLKLAGAFMEEAGLDAVLLTKPQNMVYLVGDGRLCAFAIASKGGANYVGVPKTDLRSIDRSS